MHFFSQNQRIRDILLSILIECVDSVAFANRHTPNQIYPHIVKKTMVKEKVHRPVQEKILETRLIRVELVFLFKTIPQTNHSSNIVRDQKEDIMLIRIIRYVKIS